MELKLTVTKRTTSGSRVAKALRSAGELPAVVYGAVKETQPITLKTVEFEKVWKSAGESTLISLDGLGSETLVLIQDVTTDPLYNTPIHADFLAVNADKPVEVDVPLVFVGVAPAEKELGGTLVKVMHEIEIEALPKNLPHEIEVDISSLKTFDDQVRVEDIVLPKGVTARVGASEVVALVQEAKEVEEVPAEAVDVTAVEIEKKGKEEEAPVAE
jgi:large subunit ribosomal protein L25